MTTMWRVKRVADETGLSRSSIYAHVQQGLMPAPVKMGPRISAWPSAEIAAVIEARTRGDDDQAVRTLVRQLQARRAVPSATAPAAAPARPHLALAGMPEPVGD